MANGSLAHPAPENGERLATLDPSADYITIINRYTVRPQMCRGAEPIRYVPGFVSANFHINLDCTQVVNYAQWQSRVRSRPRVPTAKLRRAHARPPRSRMVSRESSMSCGTPG